MSHRYKIDSGGIWWRYAVYKRVLFGLMWRKVYSTDHIWLAQKYIDEASVLPTYFV
jgi:hypothetical protein